MNNDSLGDRMKAYEDSYRIKLPRRVPKILRIDGKAFHTLLKDAQKPYDKTVMTAMMAGASGVLEEMGGVGRFAYIQSDECTIAINDALDYNTEPWFDNNLQKICSVSASIFAVNFVHFFKQKAAFDARLFIVPDQQELLNNLIWRQQDATRNSIQQYGRSMFSHHEMLNKSNDQVQDMMHEKFGFNWNDAPTWTKRGVVVTRDKVFEYIPKFTEDRDFLLNLFNPPPPNPNEKILP